MAASLPHLCLFLAAVSCFLPPALASQVYIVGGDKGWSLPSRANVNYEKWVSTIRPQVNDSLEFDYYKRAHSVLQVIRSDYRYCNTSDPIATFQDGKTIIKLTNPGSYYFICGVPGHCDAGQKFMIIVANTTATAAAPVASVPTAFEPALAPAESLPPFVHAVPPTTGAAAGVRSSMVVMVWGMMLASAISAMMI